jgi:aminopeptidase N
MTRFLYPLAALFLWASGAEAQRLPASVVPEAYTLKFTPDLERATFAADATIDVRLLEPTTSIVLHAAELDIARASITVSGADSPVSVALDAGKELATLALSRQVPAGPATLHFTYTGQLNDKLRGFYLSTANNRRYAVTQLQATDARRAFPSFDEPAMKATFDVTLVVDQRDTAISNGALVSDAPGPTAGKHTLKFARTPKMSPYLVAMLVGDFACRSGAADGIPIRICSTPDKLPLTGFALEAAEQQLAFYNRYFGIKYPFAKLDIVGIPDFAAGAMENTAAITFREEYLLADPATATVGARKEIAGIISHEIAHMWFGDLVTMAWWDDVWLNEGFATWLANKPLAEWKPEWQVELDDVRATQAALSLDSLQSTRPLHSAVSTPEEINEIFDAIAYQKGAAVVRMLERYVGEEPFRRGVSEYLKKYSYRNATSKDFAAEIARASSLPIAEIMASFVDLPGAPLLKVSSSCSGAATVARIEQSRFYFDPAVPSPTATPWRLPVCFKRAGSTERVCETLTALKSDVTLPGSCSPWVLANEGASGYYRVAYDERALATLRTTAASSLTSAEQLSLLEDEWALVRNGIRPAGDYLGLASALASDRGAAIMETIASRVNFVGRYLTPAGSREAFNRWINEAFGPLGAELGWSPRPDDSEDRRTLRATVLYLLGYTGRDARTIADARALADRYLANPAGIDPDLATTALGLAALSNDPALYDRYRAKLAPGTDLQAYYRYLDALTFFNEPALVDRTLELTLTAELRSQDVPTVILGLTARPESRERAWRFVTTRWKDYTEKLGVFQGMPRLVAASAAFCTLEAKQDVEAFFKSHPVPAAERTLRQVLETIDNCAGVRARQQDRLAAWLSAMQPPTR